MSKIEKAAREVIALMSTPGSCSYNEENKQRFHASARVVLKHLAEKHLGLPKSDYDLRGNLAGIAVSGEVTLHTDRIYLQLGESCLGPKFMWRTCAGRKDYHGGANQWLPYDSLSNLNLVGEILRSAA